VERIARPKKSHKPRTKREIKRDLAKRTIIKLIADDLMPIIWACKAVMIAPNTYYAWLKTDPKFAANVEAARAECMRKLIAQAKKDRGGSQKLLAAMFREDFGERKEVDVRHQISHLEIVNDREIASSDPASEASSDRPDDQEA